MEKLVDSGLLAAVIDVTTTEIADEIAGGVLSAGPERLDAIARAGVPYVGSCGALDMVNFWAIDTVPERYRAPKASSAQRQRDADADLGRGVRAHRPLHRRQAQSDAGPGALSDSRRRRVRPRRARQAVPRSRRRPRAVRSDRVGLSSRRGSQADPLRRIISTTKRSRPRWSRRFARLRPRRAARSAFATGDLTHATHRPLADPRPASRHGRARASPSSAAAPGRACPRSAKRRAASTSSSSITPAATEWPDADRSRG